MQPDVPIGKLGMGALSKPRSGRRYESYDSDLTPPGRSVYRNPGYTAVPNSMRVS